MAERYFEKFNRIYYANTLSLDLTERAVVLNSVKSNPYTFYQYDLNNGIRADQISDRYYEDQYMSWLLYMSNNVIDPYYDWYLSDEDFDNVLRKKYNCDIYLLQQKVKFYRNYWLDPNNSLISAAEYDGFADRLKKYWDPIYNQYGDVYQYKRKKEDWIVNTNYIIRYSTTGTNFIDNEIVTINYDLENTGKGQVVSSNSTSIAIQHVFGTVLPSMDVEITGTSYIYGTESSTNVVFTAATSIANNISLDEFVYWEPVYVYDYENELNSKNKSINILDNKFAMTAAKQLKKLLK